MYRKMMIMAALIAAFTIAEVNVFAQEKSAPTKGQSTSQTLPPKSQGNNLKGKGAKKRVRKHFKRRRREHQRIKAAK